jgi:cyclophilin family peptidyl-prolyl cis-trans isomerase/HEAT repeat protein
MKARIIASVFFLSLSAHAGIDPVVDAADRRDPRAPALQQAALAHFPKRRVLAAHAYGELMNPVGIDPLFALLEDPMPFVREEAAFALGQLGWKKEAAGGREVEILKKLSAILRDKRASVRAAAVEALGKVGGEETWDLVAPAFNDKEESVRAASVMAFFRARMILKLRYSKPPAELVDARRIRLEGFATDKSARVREAVAYFFARNAEPKAEAAMKKLAADSAGNVRLFAYAALAKMKSKTPPAQGLQDEQPAVRIAAVGAAVAGGAPVPESLLEDSFWSVRAAAAAALKDSPALRRSFEKDVSPSVRAEALKALAKTDPALLSTAAKSELWQVREAAALASEALGAGREKFLDALFAADKDRLVRAAALEALLALPGETTFAQLKTSLASPELSERSTAVGALAERKETDVAALAEKTYQASQDPKWVETREDLVGALEKLGDEPGLRKALQDPDRGVRAKAKSALLARGVHDLPADPEPPFTLSPFRDQTFSREPRVEFETSKGKFTVELYPLAAPIHVADFIGHAKAGFYDGLLWHRVIPNFVAQGGDPDGTGFGGAGYSLRAEINRKPFARGALGMPRSQGFDTGGGQVFFSLVPTPHLEGQYTVYGQVVDGAPVLDLLERGDRILKVRILKGKFRPTPLR